MDANEQTREYYRAAEKRGKMAKLIGTLMGIGAGSSVGNYLNTRAIMAPSPYLTSPKSRALAGIGAIIGGGMLGHHLSGRIANSLNEIDDINHQASSHYSSFEDKLASAESLRERDSVISDAIVNLARLSGAGAGFKGSQHLMSLQGINPYLRPFGTLPVAAATAVANGLLSGYFTRKVTNAFLNPALRNDNVNVLSDPALQQDSLEEIPQG